MKLVKSLGLGYRLGLLTATLLSVPFGVAQQTLDMWRVDGEDVRSQFYSPVFIKDNQTVAAYGGYGPDLTSRFVCFGPGGEVNWTFPKPTDPPFRGGISPLVTTDNLIYYSTGDGILKLTQDGDFGWHKSFAPNRRLHEMRIYGNRLLIAATDERTSVPRPVLFSIDRHTGSYQYTTLLSPIAMPEDSRVHIRSGGGYAFLMFDSAGSGNTPSTILKIRPETGEILATYSDPGYSIRDFVVDSQLNIFTSGIEESAGLVRRIDGSVQGAMPVLYERPYGGGRLLLSGGHVYVTEIQEFIDWSGFAAVRKIRPSDGITVWRWDEHYDYNTIFNLKADKYGRIYLTMTYHREGASTVLITLDGTTGVPLDQRYAQVTPIGGSFYVEDVCQIAVNLNGEIFMAGVDGGDERGFARRYAQSIEVAPDFYNVPAGAGFSTAGNGVLENDKYLLPQDEAVIFEAPAQGALTMQVNGEFTYDATTVSQGSHTFKYAAGSPQHMYGIGTVTLNVSRGLTGFTLSKNQLAGQNATLGTVSVSPASTPSVVTVYDNSSLVSTPATVTVPAGETSKGFSVQVQAVNATINTTIYASFGLFTRSAALTLNPLVPTAMAFTPSSTVTGGTTVSCRLVINGVAGPQGRTISIYDDNPYSVVPTQVTVAPGQTEVSFPITTLVPPTNQQARITAVVSSGSTSAFLRIKP